MKRLSDWVWGYITLFLLGAFGIAVLLLVRTCAEMVARPRQW
jgi:hypothetical protein